MACRTRFGVGQGGGCLSCNNKVEKVGAYPWLVMPLHNNEQLIFYVDIFFPGTSNPRRAWLVPPTAEKQVMTVTLETTRMNLGNGPSAPRVAFETSLAPLGDWVYPNMGSYLLADSVTGTYAFGLTEDAYGNLTASKPPTTIDPPNASSFEFEAAVPLQFASGNKCCSLLGANNLIGGGLNSTLSIRANPNAPLRTGMRLNAFTSDNRELRAIPVPRTARRPVALRSEPAFSPYGNEFYLSWRDPADTTSGYPAFVMFVSQLAAIPCNRQQEISGPPIIRNPNININRLGYPPAYDRALGDPLFYDSTTDVIRASNSEPILTPGRLGVVPPALPYVPCCCDCSTDGIPNRTVCRDSVRRRSAIAGESDYLNYHAA